MAQNVTDGDFNKEVIDSDIPVMVDCWASWCQPCVKLGPTIEELATQYEGIVKVLKMNVDENEATPARYGVRGIPACLFFNKGILVDSIVGAASKAAYEVMFDKVLHSN